MANTVYHYAPTSWVNGTTPMNATNMNHLETGPLDAMSGLNPDLFTAFVYSGCVCTKDGTNANQLDIASGRAYVTQTDGTLALIVVASDNTHTTATPSSTYHLYLQPDGSWYWSTSNSPQANSLAICSVTTDGSGNINVVTDLRQLITTFLPNAAGGAFPGIVTKALAVPVTVTTLTTILTYNVPVNSWYRLSGHFSTNNSASSESITFQVLYTDVTSNIAQTAWFVSSQDPSASTTAPALVSGNVGIGSNNNLPHAMNAFTINAKGGTTIQVQYHDPAGVPNDLVTAFIERLA